MNRLWCPLSKVNVWIIALSVWVVMVVFGFSVLTIYSLSAGPTAVGGLVSLPTAQPLEPITIDRPWHLLIGIHPKCPCSVSSIAELRKLMETNSDKMRCRALVFVPTSVPRDWADSASVAELRSIPGVMTEFDYGGNEMRSAGILTSGGTILYDRTDQILFHGGITPSRGHVGPNAGSDAITAIVEGRETLAMDTPIFGCRVHASQSRSK